MTQDLATYYVWIGGSCDYGHKERAGGAAVVIELMEQREQSGACSKVEELDEVNYAESRQKKSEGQLKSLPGLVTNGRSLCCTTCSTGSLCVSWNCNG